MSAEVDVTAYLNTEGVGTLGTNLFQGPVRPNSQYVPANALFVLGGGGPPAQRYLSGGAQIENRYPSVQITVRNIDYNTGKTKAEEVHNALQAAKISGYWDCKVEQSAPLYLGTVDDNYRWTVNCTLAKRTEGWHGND